MGGEKTAIMSFTLILVGAVILISSRSFLPALAGEIFIGAGMGVANAAVFKLVAKYVPEAVGGASGWVGGLGAFGGFVVPPILGVFVDVYGKEGYATGFVVYVALALISILISYVLKKKYGHELH
jgi:NNP family nitrate/nitrite transporter-like MFS transporter